MIVTSCAIVGAHALVATGLLVAPHLIIARLRLISARLGVVLLVWIALGKGGTYHAAGTDGQGSSEDDPQERIFSLPAMVENSSRSQRGLKTSPRLRANTAKH